MAIWNFMFYMNSSECLLRKIMYGWQYNFTRGDGFGESLPRMSEQLTDQVLVERVQRAIRNRLTYW